ncbi:sigma-54-dependent Fis family transcriptional regulator (plasmid) [Skermanella sp. TT6]|uniref:Sigma-54-dependent Fis family transcriptional regulator n=1 Tax=Skermanella cutis TaxID=2775420 RepID=A0ABX7BF01_9PROT|nr:sigma-54 dependent transcriptional regulator [Skermanella sp. TT6]QQP92961.1 sigma-54-dependent Fis family transcriptional regulator [Skermanella sp. TT6]
MNDGPSVLVVEDDPVLGPALMQRLRLEGFRPRLAASGTAAVEALAGGAPPHAVVSDIRLPDMDGEALYRHLLDSVGALPVYFITAHGQVDQAVRLIKAGARDYLTKPVDVDSLVAELRKACEPDAAADAAALGAAPAMRQAEAVLRKAARVDIPVLLTGETGVGKEVAARLLHAANRADRPFAAVNCAAIPRDLVESTLFGHERGAFTGAVASSPGLLARAGTGTLFLDEIAELPAEHQSKLLRVIQERVFLPVGGREERRFEARLVCATHADLAACVAAGTFREDLYFRINVVEVRIPPLRERPEDVSLLARRFLDDAVARFGLESRALSPAGLAALADHDWPGNVRELRNRIERAAVLADETVIGPADLFPEAGLDGPPVAGTGTLDEALTVATRAKVEEALRRAEGNRGQAARLLGVSRTTLWKRMRELGIG